MRLSSRPRRFNPTEHGVLHFLECSLPYKQNGYTLRSRAVLRAQRECGWDPVALTRPGFPTPWPSPRVDQIDGIRHYRLVGSPLGDRERLAGYLHRYVTQAAPIIDKTRPVVLQAASNFRNAYVALELARHYDLPFVYEVRGLWEETRRATLGLGPDDAQYRRLVAVETYCMRNADAVITLGETLKEAIIERGVDPSRIFLVPNGVDLASLELRTPSIGLRRRLGLGGRFTVGYIGSVTQLERLEILIEAMAQLRNRRTDVVALVVGDGDSLERLRGRADELGVGDTVRFAGRVAHDDTPDYYALLDTVACTRGPDRVCELVTPLKPVEAMGYAKPVISSDLPALRELVRHRDRGLLVPPLNPPALAAAIEELADSPGLREELAHNGHRWVSEHRTWTHVARNYADAYAIARRSAAQRRKRRVRHRSVRPA